MEGTIPEREQLARRLAEQLCHDTQTGKRRPRPDYREGDVAQAYLAARRITIVADEDDFALQVEVHGDILPWVHELPDGSSVKPVTQHGRTQWHVHDEQGAYAGLVFHGIGSMWQWRFQAA